MDGWDAHGDGIAGWEAVQYFIYQPNSSEITGGVLLLLLAVDTGGSCCIVACEALFFFLKTKHILQQRWLCVCRPRPVMKALLLELFNYSAFWDVKESCYFYPITLTKIVG